MPTFARRFRRWAAVVAVLAGVVVVGAVVAGFVMTNVMDPSAGIGAWVLAAVLAIAAAVQVVLSHGRSTALRQVGRQNPDGAVFLARRQPALVSDLATYIAGQADVYDQVSDRWVVASIDDRGMAAWSIGPEPRELILVPWGEIGGIEPINLESGQPGIAVDVKPFPTPLVVSVGYTAYGIMTSFGSRGVAEVIATASALRPHSG